MFEVDFDRDVLKSNLYLELSSDGGGGGLLNKAFNDWSSRSEFTLVVLLHDHESGRDSYYESRQYRFSYGGL